MMKNWEPLVSCWKAIGAVKRRMRTQGNKERLLCTHCARVGHGQVARVLVLELEVLV